MIDKGMADTKSSGSAVDGDKVFPISVIVPMHDVEDKIDRCLACLEAQELESYEVIFIDDSSTDATVAKVSAWIADRQGSERRFRLVELAENGGVAAARNRGLDEATGEYVYNLDADDWMEPDTLSTLHARAKEAGADIVGCEWFLTFERSERAMAQADTRTGDELFGLMAKGCIRWNLWLFLLRRSLVEVLGIRFIPKMNMGEDLMAMMKLAARAETVSIVHRPLYHYIQTNGAALTKNFKKSIPQVDANVEEIERYLSEEAHRPELLEQLGFLKLTLKQPLLVSDSREDYELWQTWFPEANALAGKNDRMPLYSRFLQRAARAKWYWILRLYNLAVIKVLYGMIFR